MFKNIVLYTTVFAGCFFEGETSLITSSFAAHRGYLEITIVMTVAFVATQSWDWLWFLIGRIKGKSILEHRPRLKGKANKIDRILAKYPVPLLLGYRFLYGFRTAVPIALGMSSIRKRTFFIYSLVNTFIWDVMFSSIGYFFGSFLKANLRRVEHYEFEIMGLIIISGIILGLYIRLKSVKRISNQAQKLSDQLSE